MKDRILWLLAALLAASFVYLATSQTTVETVATAYKVIVKP